MQDYSVAHTVNGIPKESRWIVRVCSEHRAFPERRAKAVAKDAFRQTSPKATMSDPEISVAPPSITLTSGKPAYKDPSGCGCCAWRGP
jgi:hypothetical protein